MDDSAVAASVADCCCSRADLLDGASPEDWPPNFRSTGLKTATSAAAAGYDTARSPRRFFVEPSTVENSSENLCFSRLDFRDGGWLGFVPDELRWPASRKMASRGVRRRMAQARNGRRCRLARLSSGGLTKPKAQGNSGCSA